MGKIMRSATEARLVYRKARTFFFREFGLSRTDKLKAAKRLRTRIRALDDRGGNSTDVANTLVSQVRQELQIERSIRSVAERTRARATQS